MRESESHDVVPEGRLELLEERLLNDGYVAQGMTVQEIRSEEQRLAPFVVQLLKYIEDNRVMELPPQANRELSDQGFNVVLKILKELEKRGGAWSSQKELIDTLCSFAAEAAEDILPDAASMAFASMMDTIRAKKPAQVVDVLQTPEAQKLSDIDTSAVVMLKLQMLLHLLVKDAKNLAPTNQGPQVVQVAYLPPLVENPCVELLHEVTKCLTSGKAGSRGSTETMSMKVPAATQSQDLLRIIEVASKTDITTCFKSLVNALITQHQFCLKHDGARYGQQRDQLQQELQLATPAVLKWASVLQKFGLQDRELPPQENSSP